MDNHTNFQSQVPNILIVDDIPDNLKILSDFLKSEGFKVRPVLSGIQALQVAEKEKPDLVLLDIMMPDMNGFEVCRRLKEHQHLGDVPVIFISALNSTEDIVKSFDCGGADFITKPFQAKEVKARVATQLKLHLQNRKLQTQSKELKELNDIKDKFFSIIAHDLRSPIGSFVSLTKMMAETDFSLQEYQELSKELQKSSSNLFTLLENLLEWSLMQRGGIKFNPELCSLPMLVEQNISIIHEFTKQKEIQIGSDIPENAAVMADMPMLNAILRNLLSNAIKFTQRGGAIQIGARILENEAKSAIQIYVKDNGIGMNPEILSKIFHIDGNVSRPGTEREPSSGLGLPLCKEFVEKHSGKMWAESEEGRGSTFYFSLPMQ